MKTYSKQLLKTSIALILALLMIVGTTATGFAKVVDIAETGEKTDNHWFDCNGTIKVIFDNSKTQWSDVQMFIGRHWGYGGYYNKDFSENTNVCIMTQITGTDLYQVTYNADNGHEPLTYIAFTNGASGWGSGGWSEANRKNATHYTSYYSPSADWGDTFNGNDCYYFEPQSSSDDCDLNNTGSTSPGYLANPTSSLNTSVTPGVRTNKGSDSSGGTAKVSGKFLSAWNTSGNRTATPNATTLARTSTATFTATAATGYSFDAWYSDSSCTTQVSTSATYEPKVDSSAITLYANFKPQTFSITYDPGAGATSGTAYTASKTYGTNYTILDNTNSNLKFKKTGYSFINWNTAENGSGTTYAAGATYSTNTNLTLYPQWEVNHITNTFDKMGGSGGDDTVTIDYGVNISTIDINNPSKTGYDFLGYYNEGGSTRYWTPYAKGHEKEGKSYGRNYAQTTTVWTWYAHWDEHTATLTYNDNGGANGPGTGALSYSQSYSISATEPTRDGYIFQGWATSIARATAGTVDFASSASYKAADTEPANATLYAVWTTAATYADASVAGYKTDTTVGSKTAISGYAKVNGGTATVTVESGTQVTYTHEAAPSGYHFDGWYNSSNIRVSTSDTYNVTVNADVTYYALFKKNYTLTLSPSSGITLTADPNKTSTYYEYGDEVTVTATYTNTEYRLDTFTVTGATASGSGTTSGSTRTFTFGSSNVTVATTSTRIYLITFKNYDGTTLQSGYVDSGSTPSYNGTTPSKTEDAQYWYDFNTWSPAIVAATANATYIATFTSHLQEYDITFNANGHGTAPQKQTIAYGSKVDKPSDLQVDGYTFGGWYKEYACTNAWNFDNDTVTGTQTLYAKWTLNSYKVKYTETPVTGGTVKIGNITIASGSTGTDITYGTHATNNSIIAPSGYTISSVTGGGTWNIAQDEKSASCNSFTVGTSGVTIEITYEYIPEYYLMGYNGDWSTGLPFVKDSENQYHVDITVNADITADSSNGLKVKSASNDWFGRETGSTYFYYKDYYAGACTLTTGTNNFGIRMGMAGTYRLVLDTSNSQKKLSVTYPTPEFSIGGTFNSWNANQYTFADDNGELKVTVPLTAGQTYEFKVFRNHKADEYAYGNTGTITGTIDSQSGWKFETTVQNVCKITPSATGNYVFKWVSDSIGTGDGSSTSEGHLWVQYPSSKTCTANVQVINSTSTGSATINGSASPLQVLTGDDAVFVVSAPTSSSQTFTFLGWYDSNDTLVSSNESYKVENISADTTLTAKYVRDLYICGTMANGWISGSNPATKMTYHAADNENPTGYYTYECTSFAASTNDEYRITGKADDYTEVLVWEYPGTGEGATVTQSGYNVKVALNAGYSQPITIRAKYTSGNNDYFDLKTTATQNAAKSVTFNIPSGETITNVSINNQSGTSASVIVGVPVTVSFNTTDDKWVEAVTSTGIQASDIIVTPNGQSNTVTATFTMPNDDVTITPTMIQLTKIGYNLYTNGALKTSGYKNGSITLSDNKTKVIQNVGTFYKTGDTVVFTAKWADNYSLDSFYDVADGGNFLPTNKLTATDIDGGKTHTYTITGNETNHYFAVEVNMYRNVYWKHTSADWNTNKTRLAYNPQTDTYTTELTDVTTDPSDSYYLSLNGSSPENMSLTKTGNITGTGISTWAGASDQNDGRCTIFGKDPAYDLPAVLTITHNNTNDSYTLNIAAVQLTTHSVGFITPSGETITNITINGNSTNPATIAEGRTVTISFTVDNDKWVDAVTATGISASDVTVTPSASSNVVTATFTMPTGDVTITPTMTQLVKVGYKKYTNGAEDSTGCATLAVTGYDKLISGDGVYFKAGSTATFETTYAANYSFAGWFTNSNPIDWSTPLGTSSTYTYTITGSEANNYYAPVADFYRNVYYKKTVDSFSTNKEILSYDPVTNLYSRTLTDEEGFTGLGGGDNDFYLSLDGQSITPLWIGNYTNVGTGVSVWHSGSGDESGDYKGSKCNLCDLQTGYKLPVTMTVTPYINDQHVPGVPQSWNVTVAATQKIQKNIVCVQDPTNYSVVCPATAYVGDKVEITFTFNASTSYINFAQTTTNPADAKTALTYNGTNKLTLTVPNVGAETITITPALTTKYRVKSGVIGKGYYSTDQNKVTMAIEAPTNDNDHSSNDLFALTGAGEEIINSGDLVDAGTKVTYTAETADDNWIVSGWYSDPSMKNRLQIGGNTYEVTPTSDIDVYVLFVRELFLEVWDGPFDNANQVLPRTSMQYDSELNRYYVDGVEFTGGQNYRFKIFDNPSDSSDKYSQNAWSVYGDVPTVDFSSGVDISRNQSTDDAIIANVHSGYSSPLTIYYDMGRQSAGKNAIYVKATYIGSSIYLSSGVDMTSTGHATQFATSTYVDPAAGSAGVTVDAQVAIYGSAGDPKVNEYITKMTQDIRSDVTVKTTISDANKLNYYVSNFVYYNADTMEYKAVKAAGSVNASGEYQATIPGGGTLYICPIFEKVGANQYVYFDNSELVKNSEWGPLAAAYFYNGSTELNGTWPAQLMIPTGDGQFYVHTTTPSGDASGLNVTFNNYLDYTAFKFISASVSDYDSAEKLGLSNSKSITQTYDYDQYSAILKSTYFNNAGILYRIKLNNDGYHGNYPDSNNENSQFVVHTDNNLDLSKDWKFQWLVNKDGTSHMSLTGVDTAKGLGYYVVSKGDVKDSVGNWATHWYIYDTDGHFITQVNSSDMYKPANATATNNAITSALESAGVTYNQESVMISYETMNNAPSHAVDESNVGTHQKAYDGQWYAVNLTAPYTVNIVTGTINDLGQITLNNEVGTASLSYGGYTNGPSAFTDQTSGSICLGNHEVEAKASGASGYSFVGFYSKDTEMLLSEVSPATLSSQSTTTFVAVFESDAENTGTINYQYKDRFGNDKVYTYTYKLSKEEKNGYAGNSDHKKGVTVLIKYRYTDGTISFGEPISGKTLDPNFPSEDFLTAHAPTGRQANVYLKNINWARTSSNVPESAQEVTYVAQQGPEEYPITLYYRGTDTNYSASFKGSNNDLCNANDTTEHSDLFDSSKTFKYWAKDAEGTEKLTTNKDFNMRFTATPKDARGEYTPFEAYAIYDTDSALDGINPYIDSIQKYREISGDSTNPENILYTDTYVRFSTKDAHKIETADSCKYGVVYCYDDNYSTFTNGKFDSNKSNNGDYVNNETIIKYAKYCGFYNKTASKTSGNHNYKFVTYQGTDGSNLTNFNRANIPITWDYNTQKDKAYVVYAFAIVTSADDDPKKTYTDVVLSEPMYGYCYNED